MAPLHSPKRQHGPGYEPLATAMPGAPLVVLCGINCRSVTVREGGPAKAGTATVAPQPLAQGAASTCATDRKLSRPGTASFPGRGPQVFPVMDRKLSRSTTYVGMR